MAVPNTDEVYLSNDPAGQKKFEYIWEAQGAIGNITATLTALPLVVPDFPGVIDNVVILMQGGGDTAHNLSLTGTVNKNGTSVATTSPSITFTSGSTVVQAGTGTVSTYAAGTGVVQVTLKNDGTQQFVAGDKLTVDFTVVRAATPQTEMSNPSVIVYAHRYTQ